MEIKNKDFIGIKTYAHLLSESDIKGYINTFEENNCEIKVYDQTGAIFNSVTNYMTEITLILSNSIVQAYLLGIATNTTYDLFKKFVISIGEKIQGKEICYCNSYIC